MIYTDLHHAKEQTAESSTTIKRIKTAGSIDAAHLSFCGRADSYLLGGFLQCANVRYAVSRPIGRTKTRVDTPKLVWKLSTVKQVAWL